MIGFDPTRELERLQLFSGVSGAVHEFPAINVWMNADDAIVATDLPGVDAKDLDIAIHGNTLTLRGKREIDAPEGEMEWLRNERIHGEFVRTVQLPFRVDASKVSASMSKGRVNISLPRAEEDKPKKVSIHAA